MMRIAPIAWRTLWAASVLAVCWGSLTPRELHFTALSFEDKFIHAGAYAWLMASGGMGVRSLAGRLWMALAMAALGGALEILQAFVPGREGSWLDMACNAAGVMLGALLLHIAGPGSRRPGPRQIQASASPRSAPGGE